LSVFCRVFWKWERTDSVILFLFVSVFYSFFGASRVCVWDPLLPAYQFIYVILFLFVFHPISSLERHSISKQTFVTVSYELIVLNLCFFFGLSNVYSLLYHSIWYGEVFTVFMLFPIYSILTFIVFSSLSYVIGWRSVETCTFIMGLFFIWAVYFSREQKKKKGRKKNKMFLLNIFVAFRLPLIKLWLTGECHSSDLFSGKNCVTINFLVKNCLFLLSLVVLLSSTHIGHQFECVLSNIDKTHRDMYICMWHKCVCVCVCLCVFEFMCVFECICVCVCEYGCVRVVGGWWFYFTEAWANAKSRNCWRYGLACVTHDETIP